MTSDDSALARIKLFVEHARNQQETRIVQSGDLKSKLEITGGPEGMSVTHHEPDEDDLRSYLLGFRKFVMDKEPVFLNRIFNLAHRHVTDEMIVHHLADARKIWRSALTQGELRFEQNGVVLPPETVLDLWINGFYFHDDNDKRERLESLWPQLMARWLFIDAIVSASKIIFYCGDTLRTALANGDVSKTPVR